MPVILFIGPVAFGKSTLADGAINILNDEESGYPYTLNADNALAQKPQELNEQAYSLSDGLFISYNDPKFKKTPEGKKYALSKLIEQAQIPLTLYQEYIQNNNNDDKMPVIALAGVPAKDFSRVVGEDGQTILHETLQRYQDNGAHVIGIICLSSPEGKNEDEIVSTLQDRLRTRHTTYVETRGREYAAAQKNLDAPLAEKSVVEQGLAAHSSSITYFQNTLSALGIPLQVIEIGMTPDTVKSNVDLLVQAYKTIADDSAQTNTAIVNLRKAESKS